MKDKLHILWKQHEDYTKCNVKVTHGDSSFEVILLKGAGSDL